jgi:hypothetical protein
MRAGNQASPQRCDAEAVHEQVMKDVSDVQLNLEHTISRARKGSDLISPTLAAWSP